MSQNKASIGSSMNADTTRITLPMLHPVKSSEWQKRLPTLVTKSCLKAFLDVV
jgi:hypothetical protein